MCPVKCVHLRKDHQRNSVFQRVFCLPDGFKTFFGRNGLQRYVPALSQAFPTNGNYADFFFIIHLKVSSNEAVDEENIK